MAHDLGLGQARQPDRGRPFEAAQRRRQPGLGLGQVYGDPNRPGGAHISGGSDNAAAMPAFGDVLNDHQLYSVARYVREVIGGEAISDEVAAERDAEWEHLGGGALTGGGGGGGH